MADDASRVRAHLAARRSAGVLVGLHGIGLVLTAIVAVAFLLAAFEAPGFALVYR